jgi:hypothetical protein
MTDRPATLSLAVNEWRKLVQANLEQAFEFTQGHAEITADEARGLAQHLDRMKALVMAWHASARPPAQTVRESLEEAEAEQAAKPAEEQPKKRGWPLGKPRGPRKRMNPQVMQ